MPQDAVPTVSDHPVKLTIKRPGTRRPQTQGRVRFTYDGERVSATAYRSAQFVGEGEVLSVVKTGGCGCGGRLGLHFTLTNGDEWFV